MFSDLDPRSRWILLGLAAAGLSLRLGYVFLTREQAAHPDLFSFAPDALPFTHPFDTSPREPVFVWWLWLLGRLGLDSVAEIRAAGTLWFPPSLFLLFQLGRRLAGSPAAWTAAILFTFLPGQIQGDAVGLRHLLESAGLLLFLNALAFSPSLTPGFARAAGSFALITLTRLTYATSGALLLGWASLRSRRWKPLLAGIPAAILVLVHFANNRARFGDPLHSINLHTYWFANLENVGRPGFHPTEADRRKDVFRKSLTYRQWAFEAHTLPQYAGGTLVGYGRFLWDFPSKVYFRVGLPRAATGILLLWFFFSLGQALWTPRGRTLLIWTALLVFPYGFVGHVFWAGRFFLPFAPLALILMGRSGVEGWTRLRNAQR
jgi:hypothetical protein